MKHYKQILCVLGGVLVLTLGVLAYWVYQSGTEEQRKDKLKAEMLLKYAAETWVNQEFEKLGVPYSSGGGKGKAKSLKRRIVIAEGDFVVDVDSAKEEKCLFDSDMLNGKSNFLFLLGKPSIDGLNKQWQEYLDNGFPHYRSALKLVAKMPPSNKGEVFFSDDSIFSSSKNKLGNYYLDNMYYLELSAYLLMPPVWQSADWSQINIIVCIVILLLCLSLIFFVYTSNKRVKSISVPLLSDGVISSVTKDIYQIGNVQFNEKDMTVTFRDNTVHCTKQTYKLLSAFVHAEGHFLSNTKITEICDWVPGDVGISERRRAAMAQLRKVLNSKESYVNLKYGKNEMREDGFYLILEE